MLPPRGAAARSGKEQLPCARPETTSAARTEHAARRPSRRLGGIRQPDPSKDGGHVFRKLSVGPVTLDQHSGEDVLIDVLGVLTTSLIEPGWSPGAARRTRGCRVAAAANSWFSLTLSPTSTGPKGLPGQ